MFKKEDFFSLKNIIESLFKFIEDKKNLVADKEEEEEKDINFKEMMEYIYVQMRKELKDDKSEKDKSNEINNNKKSGTNIPDKTKSKRREQILNKFLKKFLENKYNIKISDKNEHIFEKYIEKFFEEDIKIKLLYKLITKGKIENKGEYYESIKQFIEGIKDDIINKTIEKKYLKN